jgi:diadenylate cyclase
MLCRGTHNNQLWRTNHAEHTSLRLGLCGHAMTIAVLKALCSRVPWCEPAVLESSLELALEIAREGREGRRIGTLFTVGKAEEVLAASRALILDPLAGHAPARTHIGDPDLRGTMKELAQLDGAFVISETGIVVAACRYLDASVEQIDLPLGFGSRHLAAASISQRLGALAIVVSESGVVRVFHAGQIEATLIPELWLLDRHHTQLSIAAAGAIEAQRLESARLSLNEMGEES